MADIDKLRRLAQANCESNSVDSLYALQDAFDYKTVLELLDRLEVAEKEVESLRQGIAFRDDVVAALAVERDNLRAELSKQQALTDAAQHIAGVAQSRANQLQARVTEMEKQEPVATIHINSITGNPSVDFIPGHRYLHHNSSLYALPGAQQCKNCNGMGDRFDSGEKIPCDLCESHLESHLEEIRSLVAEAAHDIISGSDFWLSTSLAAKKIYALPGAQRTQSAPDISDDMIEAIESRAEQSYRRHHSGIRGQQITPADAFSWHIIRATRSVLVEAMEASRAP